MHVHIVNTHTHTYKVVPVAERWTAASEGTPSRVRAHGGGAEPCPGSPASPSGSPAASPSPSACWPLRTPGSPCCLPRLLLLGAPSRWSHLLPSRCRALPLPPLQVMRVLRPFRFAHPQIWWASPRTSSWDRGVCVYRFNEENYAADCAWKMSLFVRLGSFFLYAQNKNIYIFRVQKYIIPLVCISCTVYCLFLCDPSLSTADFCAAFPTCLPS